jgi:hypothetical protein
MRKSLIMLLVLLSAVSGVYAVSARPVSIPYLRALAMGNAFNAMPDDHMAFLNNPAMLATNTEFKFKIAPAIIGYDPGTNSVIGDAYNIYKLLTGKIDWAHVDPGLQDKLNKQLSLGFTASALGLTMIIPSQKIGNLGFGIYNSADVFGEMDPAVFPALPTITSSVYLDVVLTAGWSYDFDQYIKNFPGKLYGGASVKKILRAQALIPTTTVDYISTTLGAGSGIGFDIGALYSLPNRENLRFSLAMKDITATTIDMSDGSSSKINPRINLGVSYRPKALKFGKNKEGNDIKFDFGNRLTLNADINSFLSGDASKNYHLGAEYSWALLALRVGVNQGLLTYGLRLFNFIEYAAYQEDPGTGITRHLVYLSIEF